MKRESIERMIDNVIKKSLQEKSSPIDVISDLERKLSNVFRIVEKDNIDISDLFEYILNGGDIDNDDKISSRVKYVYYYTTHCRKRINDIKWIIGKLYSNNFISSRKYTYKSMFDIIFLKEKLSIENSVIVTDN